VKAVAVRDQRPHRDERHQIAVLNWENRRLVFVLRIRWDLTLEEQVGTRVLRCRLAEEIIDMADDIALYCLRPESISNELGIMIGFDDWL
jgi:hypothetical protein